MAVDLGCDRRCVDQCARGVHLVPFWQRRGCTTEECEELWLFLMRVSPCRASRDGGGSLKAIRPPMPRVSPWGETG